VGLNILLSQFIGFSYFVLCTFVPTKVPKTPDRNYWRELHYID